MSTATPFERILASLHEAALDDSRWPATSALIDEAFGANGNSIVFSARTDDDARIFFSSFLYRGERHEDWEREYFTDYYHLDERIPRLLRLPNSRIVHATDLYTADERKRSVVFNEMLPRIFVRDSLNMRLDGPRGSRIVWLINDPVAGDGWSSGQVGLVRSVLPHLRHYLRVRQVLTETGALGASLAALLDRTGSGVLHLDWGGRIVGANDAARELLRRGDAVFAEAGFLRARRPRDDAALQQLLARALSSNGASRAGGSMIVTRPGVLAGCPLHVSPVVASVIHAPHLAALVLVVEPRGRGRIDPALVQAVLGLTPAESRIAVRLAAGESVQEIMAATGRTENTIRWHMRQIFQKHGLTRQGELIRLVLSLAAPPEPPG